MLYNHLTYVFAEPPPDPPESTLSLDPTPTENSGKSPAQFFHSSVYFTSVLFFIDTYY